jgi:transcription-repair coupling factor (superfamily II helicase)
LTRVRRLERLEDFRKEVRDRFGPLPESTEWLLRLAEIRLLAARWQIATLHLEQVPDKSVGPMDLVLGYRSSRKIKRLAERAGDRLRIVDEASAYYRLAPTETEPDALYLCLRDLLRLPSQSL